MSINPASVPFDTAMTLADLFHARILHTPDQVAYRQYDMTAGCWVDTCWHEMGQQVGRWQLAMQQEGLVPGDRVGIMMPNCREWVIFDQAALGLGLVSVPLFYNDRGGNVAYIVQSSAIKLLLIDGPDQWRSLEPVKTQLQSVGRIISMRPLDEVPQDERIRLMDEWLPDLAPPYQNRQDTDPGSMSTLVYTSGTTGQPKGVMLSHQNILSNTYEALQTTTIHDNDIMLSFLPLSHMLERTGGYYLPMMAGITVAFARSVQLLAEDLVTIRPTLMISVPRIYEKIYAKIQSGLADSPPLVRKLFDLAVTVGWKRFLYQQKRAPWSPSMLGWPLLERVVARKVTARLGGRLRMAISGGAPLPPAVARTFLALGVPVLQGYGLTESSPVLTVSRLHDNIPESVGQALPGTRLKIGEHGELLAKGSAIMLGFWNNAAETARVIDADGWFHTGDIADIDQQGHVYITGRIKDIIVLANGEKVSPADMEMAIAMDPFFEQVMVIGEGRAFLCALVTPNPQQWEQLAESFGLEPDNSATSLDQRIQETVIQKIDQQIAEFPGYAKIRYAIISRDYWSIENGMLTPTLKIKRSRIIQHCTGQITRAYANH